MNAQQYQVTFVKNGIVLSRSIQTATSSKEAISIARMYHGQKGARGRAVPVSELPDSDCY